MTDTLHDDAVLRAVFDCASTAIAVVDKSGRLARFNRALERFLGYTEAELRQKALADVLHPSEVGEVSARLGELWGGRRESYRTEQRYIGKGGRVVWGRLTVSPAPGLGFLIGTIEDITDVRGARDESSRLLSELGERVKELTALHSCAAILSRPELSQHTLLEYVVALLPPAFQWPDRASARVCFMDVVHATEGFEARTDSLRARFEAGGREGTFEVVYRAAASPAGSDFLPEEQALLDSFASMVGRALDRRGTEERLRRSRERLSLALSAAEMGVWEWDVTANRVSWSEEGSPLVGETGEYSTDCGANRDRVHPDDRERLDATLDEARRGARPNFEVDFRLARPGGGYRRMTAKGQAIRSDAAVVRVVAVLSDVTVRRNMEDGLRQSQKMEALGLLAGGVAHDFNNVLSVVTSNCDYMLQELPPDDPRHEAMTEIAAAANTGVGLVKQLLAFGRRSPYTPTSLDVVRTLENLEPLLRRLLGRTIRLETALSPSVGAVSADATQLEQIVMNLVVNARDAMPDGGVVTLAAAQVGASAIPSTTEASPAHERYVMLTVADSGCGISEAILAQIYEPFFTTKGPDKGTGLGLAVVFGAVKQCQGHVAVESQLGRGTTFKVFLPSRA